MAWLLLFVAGVFEVAFATALKYSEGLTKIVPTVTFLVCGAISLWLLTTALRTIPLGTAYAVWTGIGAFGTAIVGIVLLGEPATAARLVLLATLIGSILGLRFWS
ncbi:MAG: multidrug efflux SMR transporter [Armatimonadetes bacterium]|nr:multidrug efflux SMR transporter [Armatimonadota bacterium]